MGRELEEERYITTIGFCEVNGAKWLIDKNNYLYKVEDEKYTPIVNLSCFVDNRYFQYQDSGMFVYKENLFCLPGCGEFISVYNTLNGKCLKIELPEVDWIRCTDPVFWNGRLFIFSTAPGRELIIIDVETLEVSIETDFCEKIKEFEDENSYFLTNSVVQKQDKAYFGALNTNTIVEFNLENGKLRKFREFPKGVHIEYLFLDNGGDFWVSDKTSGQLIGLKSDNLVTFELDNSYIKDCVWKGIFVGDMAIFISRIGNGVVTINLNSKDVVYKRIVVGEMSEKEAEKESFLKNIELINDKVVIWLGEYGRVETDIDLIEQKFYKMDKNEDASVLEILRNEKKVQEIYDRPFANVLYESRNNTMERFLFDVMEG